MIKYDTKSWWGNKLTLVADDGIAMISVSFEDELPGIAEIHDLKVYPPFRRKGYATFLMKSAESEISKHPDIHTISLIAESNSFLPDWYIKLGYHIVDQDLFTTELEKEI